MPEYQITSASEDWPRYIAIFNRLTKYAPYTIPLTPELVAHHISPTSVNGEHLILIGKNAQEEGIIHVGYPHENNYGCGLIYLLFADGNNIAEFLLREAETWFKTKGLNVVRACNWRPNPYKYILHGQETYVWGGATATLNAYRRLNYDVDNDTIIMICDMPLEPAVNIPKIPDLILKEMDESENDLVRTGSIKAFIGELQVGYCHYYLLKSISAHFRYPLGQIAIDTKEEFHGRGLGNALLMSAHRKLYQAGARHVMLHTVQALFRAVKLYEKSGYKAQVIKGYCFSKELR